MPIRFRCAYCNQLMGISHRKVGTIVRCPKCSGQVVVPHMDETPETDRLAPQAPEPDNVVKALEDPELEMLLAGAAKETAGLLKSKRKASRQPMIEIDVEPVEIPLPAGGTLPHAPGVPAPAMPRVGSLPPVALPAGNVGQPPMISLSRPWAIGVGVAILIFFGLTFAAGFILGKMSVANG